MTATAGTPSPLVEESWGGDLSVAPPHPYHAVHDLDGLGHLLELYVRAGGVQNALLSAAGMWQVVDDHMRRDVASLTRVAKYAGRLPGPAGAVIAAGLRTIVMVTRRLRWAFWGRSEPRLAFELAMVSGELAELLARASVVDAALAGRARAAAAAARRARRRLRHTMAVPPRCFFSFDQRPEDCAELASRFAERWPDRGRPLLVVGVRTSGSYLGPLLAAHLRLLGYASVSLTSWRPGQPVLGAERRRLRELARAGGMALIVDDPPTSGGSLARVARELEGWGLPHDAVVLLLQTFASPGWWSWPHELAGREMVVLPFDEWAIGERFQPWALKEDLEALLVGRSVTVDGETVRVSAVLDARRTEVGPACDLGAAPATGREHVRAVVQARLLDQSGHVWKHHVLARGAGLGLFGDQPAAIGERLAGLVPEAYGTRDGLFFRAWLPEAPGVPGGEALARAAAAYVARRRTALPVPDDVAIRMDSGDALVARCARWAGALYGGLALFFRPALLRASRRLLAHEHPALIDGDLRPADWLPAAGGLLKSGFEERTFRYQEPFSYDPAYDLASAAAWSGDGELGATLRREYRELTGDEVSEERWLLHQLLSADERRGLHAAAHQGCARHLRRWPRDAEALVQPSRLGLLLACTESQRAMSLAHARYLGDVYLGGEAPAPAGPLCAIDLDGVLETAGPLSYPATTAAGAMALRALGRHALRPVLVTGRSLDDVRERCAAYRLVGGVAEYGAAIYDHRDGRAISLLDDAQRSDLARLRATLLRDPEIVLDPRYRHGIRAWRLVGARTRGLLDERIAEALASAGLEERVRAVQGWAQTDFVPVGVDKGTGSRALAELLGDPSEGPCLALAVGDTASDLPMFTEACLAVAPANADAETRAVAARGGVLLVPKPAQEGLALAVKRLLGHAPGGCRACAAPVLEGDTRLLVTMLGASGRGRAGRAAQGLRLAWEAYRR